MMDELQSKPGCVPLGGFNALLIQMLTIDMFVPGTAGLNQPTFMNLQASYDAFSPLKRSSKETKVPLAFVYVVFLKSLTLMLKRAKAG